MKEEIIITDSRVQASLSWILKSPHRFLAFGFGSGLVRPAPGTWGTLLALLLWFPLSHLLQSDWLIGGFLVLGERHCRHNRIFTAKITKKLALAAYTGIFNREIPRTA